MDKPDKIQNPAKSLLLRPKKMHGMLEKVTQEMYRRNFELAETNKILSLLRKIDELALESHDNYEEFSGKIVQAIARTGDYPLVALFSQAGPKSYLELCGIQTESRLTTDQETLLHKIHLDESEAWLATKEQIIYLEKEQITEKFLKELFHMDDSDTHLLRDFLSLKTLVAIKLSARQKLVGIMVIGVMRDIGTVSPTEKLLFERLSEAVGLAVDNKLLFEENQRIVKQLKRTNEKLKALDETKDEFISMASHQLRTPLTSVKGYISMVMEGDAGKISASQSKLLNQAFVSSQRMVYLIADLLNVSRLRTGKFVIEAKPTNLAELVEGEIGQLKETAAGRSLELTYEKPKEFTSLMLDETKIRQVVMNFVDNAIYYTPAGGHINVKVSETPEAVEFTVTDDGLGVPKAEQHHLFGKFYRAGNAKKARPDGTGLGLFMAKKVIIAQGGSIIFSSTEGKGSTFGFHFGKAKLAVPAHIKAENGLLNTSQN